MKSDKHIPQHVAIIMDGNGRWAQRQGKDRTYGHIHGVESVRKVVERATERGVKYLTLYAFSTENWGRPESEVTALMELLCESIAKERDALCAQGVKMKFIGRRSRMSAKVLEHINMIEQHPVENLRLTLVLALDYSSRWEITEAIRKLAAKVEKGELIADQITPEMVDSSLDTVGMPDPDLMIRTSGEYRLSNFLLWQAAYCELYFTDTYWPDFDGAEFDKALESYTERDRRYGKVAEMIEK